MNKDLIFLFKDMRYIFIRLLTYNENIYLFIINTYFYNKYSRILNLFIQAPIYSKVNFYCHIILIV